MPYMCHTEKMPPIRVYFLAFESKTGCLFSSLTPKQGAKLVLSLRARVHIHSTVWHPPVGFDLFVFFACEASQTHKVSQLKFFYFIFLLFFSVNVLPLTCSIRNVLALLC